MLSFPAWCIIIFSAKDKHCGYCCWKKIRDSDMVQKLSAVMSCSHDNQ